MKIIRCIVYLIIISALSFFLGRIIPKNLFCAERFPYRAFPFEDGGKIYNKLKIKKWQSKVPDMSKILPFMMPPKNMSGNYKERLPRMIQETCVAEFIHVFNSIIGLYGIKLCPNFWGVAIVLIYIFILNLPFAIIQRYNRPRLLKLAKKMKAGEEETVKGEKAVCEC